MSVVLGVLLMSGCSYVPTAQQPGDQTASGVRSPSPSPSPVSTICPNNGLTPRQFPAATYDADHTAVVVFGGTVDRVSVAETWIYAAGCWRQETLGAGPAGRQSAVLVHDPAVHKVILLGGRKDEPNGPPYQTIPGDAWSWDGESWTQVSNAPHFGDVSAAYDEAHRQVVVLGAPPEGAGTWIWDGISWSRVAGRVPDLRYNSAMCFDRTSQSVLLFGGTGVGTGIYGDTWLWDGKSWTQQYPVHSPPKRWAAGLACGSKPLVFGGWADYQGRALADTWIWNGSDWEQLSPSHNPPSGQVFFGAFDGARPLMFGATAAGGIWAWNGSDWVATT